MVNESKEPESDEKLKRIPGFLASQTLLDDNIYPEKHECQYFLALFFSFFSVVLVVDGVVAVVVLFVACLSLSPSLFLSSCSISIKYDSATEDSDENKISFLSACPIQFFPPPPSPPLLLHLSVVAGAATG